MPLLAPTIPVCIDGRMLVPGATGVGRYAEMLLSAIGQVGGRPMVLADLAPAGGRAARALAGISGRRRVAIDGVFGPGVERLAGRHLFRAAQERFTMTGRFLEVECDGPAGVMHWTYPVPLVMRGWRNIYTIHDVIPLDTPDMSPVPRPRLAKMLAIIAAVADRIVTVSAASRAAILAHIDVPADRVVDCGQAVEVLPSAGTYGPIPAGLRPGGYHLYCGLVEPRKNLRRLIDAHALSGIARPLVIAGPDGWRAEETGAADGGKIIRIPYLSRSDLMTLMGGAHAFLFPSLAEGFGLPVIEAMGLDIPVLTSARGALAEVAGPAALLVDPEDVSALAGGIVRMDADAALRMRLILAGRECRERFTLARFAAALGTVYAEAIAVGGAAD